MLDEAHVLSSADIRVINTIAGALSHDRQVPLFVVTIPSLASHDAGDSTIERYGRELFNAWRIGVPEAKNGILLLVTLDDGRAQITLGAGWDRTDTDQAKQITARQIMSRFNDGRVADGIIGGVRGLDALARGVPQPPGPRRFLTPQGYLIIGLFALVALGAGVIFRLIVAK